MAFGEFDIQGHPTIFPTAVAYGSGGLYVADAQAGLFGGSGAVASTLSSTSLDWATGIAVDGSGNVFLVDSGTGAVYEVYAIDGSITQLNTCTYSYCPGGYWTSSDGPQQATSQAVVDSSGNVYVSDGYDLWEYSGGSWSVASTVGGYGLGVDGSNNIYLADDNNCVIWKVTSSGHSIVAGNQYSCDTSSGDLDYPQGVAVDGSGNLYISNTGAGTVLKNGSSLGAVNTPLAVSYTHLAQSATLIDPVDTTSQGIYPVEPDSITTPELDERAGL